MPTVLAIGALLWMAAQTAWSNGVERDRLAHAGAETLATALMVAADREGVSAVDGSECSSAGCGVEVGATGAVGDVVPGQHRLTGNLRVYRKLDGSVAVAVLQPGFRDEGRSLDARQVARALWRISGGDPRLGVVQGLSVLNPLGARPVETGTSPWESGTIVGQSR